MVADPSEPGSVLRAVEDLQRDLERVLGKKSPPLGKLPADEGRPTIVVTCGESTTAAVRDAALRGAEAHAVFVRGNRIVLQGADPRGTIYSFSDQFLDVTPCWFGAEWKPTPWSSAR